MKDPRFVIEFVRALARDLTHSVEPYRLLDDAGLSLMALGSLRLRG
jgi:hypothetical protein